MKKIGYLLLLLTFLGVYSCGESRKEKSETVTLESEGINECDEFLATYEEWIDNYIAVIDAYFNNPNDENAAAKYMELMEEATSWNTKWISLMKCADDEKYKERFKEISKEVENKLEELGL